MPFRRAVLVLLLVLAAPASAAVVGQFGTDWTGNDIVVESIADPSVKGITCHLTYFSRGLIDRLWQGNVFEDPSNSSIACAQTGPIEISEIDLGKGGEEIFSQRQSLIFKHLAVRRIYDKSSDSLIYVAYSRQVKQASAKMAVSAVPLWNSKATWEKGKPG